MPPFLKILTAVLALVFAAPSWARAADVLSLAELKARHGAPEDRYADIGGVSVRYRDEGRGPAVVLLHGSFGSLNSYDGLAPELGARYRVIRLDTPGMGLTAGLPADQPTATPTIDAILKALLDRLGIDKAVLVGVSSGGTAAYHFAAANPGRVAAVVLSNTPIAPVPPELERSPALAAEFAEAKRTGFKRRSYWQTYLEWLAGDPRRMTPQIIDKYYDFNRREPLAGGRNFSRLTRDPAATSAALAAVRGPVLLVWGAKDPVLPLDKADALRAALSGAQVSSVVMDDVGHYPPLEAPGRFAELIQPFLAAAAP